MKRCNRISVAAGGALVIFFLFGFLPPAFAELPQVLKESFDYPEGTLGGRGDDTGGWGGPWEPVSPGYAEIVTESMGLDIIPNIGNLLMVFEAGTTFRYLAETWPDDGGEYWISMLYKRFDEINFNDSYNGLSLFLDNDELLYIGKPWGNIFLGLDGTGVGVSFSEVDAYDGGWMVVQLLMTGDSANDEAYLFINPDPNVQPDISQAAAHVPWKGSRGFNRLRIGSGNYPRQAECYYDEIRISRTYAGLTAEEGTAVRDETELPQGFRLLGNFPNPFNPSTTVRWSLERSETVKVEIADLQGRIVRTLAEGVQSAGQHELQWDGCDEFGRPVPSGIYICRLSNGNRSLSSKMTLIR